MKTRNLQFKQESGNLPEHINAQLEALDVVVNKPLKR
jgi:hypothetical protein